MSHQFKQYECDKQKIQTGEHPHNTLLIQDFTQLKVQGTFFQCYIFTIYKHDAKEADGLKCKYFLFLRPSKNDIRFVIQGWKKLLAEKVLDGVVAVHVWSDGGPKHFKMSANMVLMSIIDEELGKQKLNYNFFEAYHGHNACDSVASQAKHKLNTYQHNYQIPLTTRQVMVSVLATTHNHNAALIPSLHRKQPQINTMKNITSFYSWTFNGAGRCQAQNQSGVITKTYHSHNETVDCICKL